MTSFGSDFGQKVDLTASIRNILRNYPEGTAILKELIQNADDAGARTISFTLDCRSHPSVTLADAALSEFQGPALHVFNDAVFTEEDFKSIQRIGDSLKKTAETKSKIGRFGIGFNAVYHWTDLPSFVSTNYLVMLDPQARFLPNVNPSNPGKLVDFLTNKSVITSFRDQFLPYEGYGGNLDWSKPFPGTLFRLPLRTASQAETSLLSRRALSLPEAVELLVSLQQEASSMLLFLKNIESIEIKHWLPGDKEPRRVFACEITNLTTQLRGLRSFAGGTNSSNSGTAVANAAAIGDGGIVIADFSLRVRCSTSNASTTSSTLSIPTPSPQQSMVVHEEQWEVCNQLGGILANAIAADQANTFLRLVPWGGVAACIGHSSEPALTARAGLAYCFLPLPVHTGLPIMVNGFFELSSNRRDIWQAGGPGNMPSHDITCNIMPTHDTPASLTTAPSLDIPPSFLITTSSHNTPPSPIITPFHNVSRS